MRVIKALCAGALGAVLLTGVAACGGDKTSDDSAASGEATGAPEDLRTSAGEVAAGLRVIAELSSDVAGLVGSDKNEAKAANEEIEPTWAKIEGTIKENDQEVYLDFEDQLAVLGGAVDTDDQAKAKGAAEKLKSLGDGYLARFPADGSAASASPSSTATPMPSASASSSASSGASSGTASSDVAAGLKEIEEIALSAAAAAGSDVEEAQALVDKIEPVWRTIEDELRGKDKDAYLTFEDAFAALGKAISAEDEVAAKSASDKIGAAADDYVKQHAT